MHFLYEEVRGYAAPIKLKRERVSLDQLLEETWEHLALTRQGRQARLVQEARREEGENGRMGEWENGRMGESETSAVRDSSPSPLLPFSPSSFVDPQALQHVFRNLLENSLQACSDPVEIKAIWTEVDLNGQAGLRLSLADNGPGLTAETRKKLFEPFFTTKLQGTGLGLAICRRIIEAHQGTIKVATDSQCGTEIIIILPIISI